MEGHPDCWVFVGMQCTSEASAKNDPLPRSQWLDMIANPQEHGDMKFCAVRIVSFQGNKVNGWFSTATVGVVERHLEFGEIPLSKLKKVSFESFLRPRRAIIRLVSTCFPP